MKHTKLTEYFVFLVSRQTAKTNKDLGGPWPWSYDPIIQEYRFCNVFREDDRTTKWIKENIRDKYADNRYLWFALSVSRRINYISTLIELEDRIINWNPFEVEYILHDRMYRGKQVYSRAYSLTTCSRKMHKNEFTVWGCLDKLWQAREQITEILERKNNTIQEITGFLTKYPGISYFIAYEIATDMRHTRYLNNARDIMSWANPGPGAVRGINRLYGNETESRIKACQAVNDMQYLLSVSKQMLPSWFPEMEMRDIEHSLCEFDKYLRIKEGRGRGCRKYRYEGK